MRYLTITHLITYKLCHHTIVYKFSNEKITFAIPKCDTKPGSDKKKEKIM